MVSIFQMELGWEKDMCCHFDLSKIGYLRTQSNSSFLKAEIQTVWTPYLLLKGILVGVKIVNCMKNSVLSILYCILLNKYLALVFRKSYGIDKISEMNILYENRAQMTKNDYKLAFLNFIPKALFLLCFIGNMSNKEQLR